MIPLITDHLTAAKNPPTILTTVLEGTTLEKISAEANANVVSSEQIQTIVNELQQVIPQIEHRIKSAMQSPCIFYGPDCNPLFAFLNNEYPSPVEFGELQYTCAMAAYEAQKFLHRSDIMHRFTTLDAGQAFSLSAEKHLDKDLDWYARREEIMSHVLRAKFKQNPDLTGKLSWTIDKPLILHSSFHKMDPFWTDNSDGSGTNHHGFLLMQLRKELCEIEIPPYTLENKKQITYPCEQVGPSILPNALNKTAEEILAEIQDLNAKIDEANYALNSKIARDPATHYFTRFPSNNFPFDQTLVPLSSKHYINASFVLGKEYIGTQSPLPRTTEDFWSMVIEHNVSTIIMLNRLGDPGDHIYFPFALQNKCIYGPICLELTEEPQFTTHPSWRQSPHEEEPHAIIHRKLKISQEGKTPIYVDHFQYQNWRDFSAGNERATAYLVKTVHALKGKEKPIVIHCHAGVGRTSVMVTLLDQYPELLSGTINIKHSVERQRSPNEGRCNSMMQSTDQYAFCYRVLRLLHPTGKNLT